MELGRHIVPHSLIILLSDKSIRQTTIHPEIMPVATITPIKTRTVASHPHVRPPTALLRSGISPTLALQRGLG